MAWRRWVGRAAPRRRDEELWVRVGEGGPPPELAGALGRWAWGRRGVVDVGAGRDPREGLAWARGLVAAGMEVSLRGGWRADGGVGELVAAGIASARGALPGASGDPLRERLEPLVGGLTALRSAAGASPRDRGPVPVEIAGGVAPGRIVELPMLILGAGPLRPRAIRLRVEGAAAGPDGAQREAIRAGEIEARRLGCAVRVAWGGAGDEPCPVDPTSARTLWIGPQGVGIVPAGGGLGLREEPDPRRALEAALAQLRAAR